MSTESLRNQYEDYLKQNWTPEGNRRTIRLFNSDLTKLPSLAKRLTGTSNEVERVSRQISGDSGTYLGDLGGDDR
jgi:hypothetical protein